MNNIIKSIIEYFVPEKTCYGVYLKVHLESGLILKASREKPTDFRIGYGSGYINLTDFEFKESDVNKFESLKDKKINMNEFPLWRKNDLTKKIIELEFNQIKGYLV